MRIGVRFGGAAGADEAALVQEGFDPPADVAAVARFGVAPARPGHGIGCACCVPRGPAALALTELFLGRARGTLPDFAAVVVVADTNGEAAVRTALETDILLRARFFALD
ncbi:hypothetical protein [Acidocella sp. C78]|uniref:hypothetical protein n=1 Tax=Acidocella sp. C78 TaxID=1671486 RepID=UPI00191BB308|nr:hypothetical protein [Acidocella sp. C78]